MSASCPATCPQPIQSLPGIATRNISKTKCYCVTPWLTLLQCPGCPRPQPQPQPPPTRHLSKQVATTPPSPGRPVPSGGTISSTPLPPVTSTPAPPEPCDWWPAASFDTFKRSSSPWAGGSPASTLLTKHTCTLTHCQLRLHLALQRESGGLAPAPPAPAHLPCPVLSITLCLCFPNARISPSAALGSRQRQARFSVPRQGPGLGRLSRCGSSAMSPFRHLHLVRPCW